MSTTDGYIYVTGWDKFQHYHDRNMIWMKVYTDLLDNDAFRSLSNADRGLLLGIWLLTARMGNGRVRAGYSQGTAKVEPNSSQGCASLRQLSDQLGTRIRQLDRLIDAGFITVRASKAKRPASKSASTEERGSKEPLKKKKRGALAAEPPARQPHFQKGKQRDAFEDEELADIDYRSLMKNLGIVKPMP